MRKKAMCVNGPIKDPIHIKEITCFNLYSLLELVFKQVSIHTTGQLI